MMKVIEMKNYEHFNLQK